MIFLFTFTNKCSIFGKVTKLWMMNFNKGKFGKNRFEERF